MAGWGKPWLCKTEKPSSGPSTHKNLGPALHVQNSNAEEVETGGSQGSLAGQPG